MQHVLEQLTNLLEKYRSLADPQQYDLESDLEHLSEWMKNGQSSPIPIELSRWGVTESPTLSPLERVSSLDAEAENTTSFSLEYKTDSSTESETQWDEVHIESLEERRFNQAIKEVRSSLDSGKPEKLQDAISQINILLSQPDLMPEQRELAQQTLAQAQNSLEQVLAQMLNEADQARASGDFVRARASYQNVLRIDSENQSARGGLQAIGTQQAEALSLEQTRNLRVGLRVRDNITTLENAVREAEALDAEERLPNELQVLAQEARQAFDRLRNEMGQITTQARYGSLSQSKLGAEIIRRYIAEGQQVIRDPIRGDRTPSEALDEANALWLQRSLETVQYTLQQIEKYLPQRPHIARTIYQNSLYEKAADDETKTIPRPFHQDAHRLLENKEREIQAYLDALQQAEETLESASLKDPVEVYLLTKQAQSIFPYLEGIELRLAEARQVAINTLESRIGDILRQAKSALGMYQFTEARNSLRQAGEILSVWTEMPLPAELIARREGNETIYAEIERIEKDRNEYFAAEKLIRTHREDSEKLKMAFRILDDLKRDGRFSKYAELRALELEMDDFRGVDEQIWEAKAAAFQGDWERVFNLTHGKTSPNLADDMRRDLEYLFTRADLEMKISEAQTYLENLDVFSANRILSRLTSPNNPSASEINQRMEKELALIHEAIKEGDPYMKPLFEKAMLNAQKEGVAERLMALHLFRHVGGLENLPGEETYRLSLQTAKARQEATRLASTLRTTVLQELIGAYKKYANAKTPLSPNQLRTWGMQARGLREAHLLHSENERTSIRWLEISLGELDARILEETGKWQEAVEVWEKLDLHYPITDLVQKSMRRAQLELALQQGRRALEIGHTQQALEYVRKAQENSTLLRAWQLNLLLADIHAERGDFTEAFQALQHVEETPENAALLVERKKKFSRERTITTLLEVAQAEENKGRLQSALQTLVTKQNDPDIATSGRIRRKRETLFNQLSNTLLQTVENELAENTYPGKIKALIALLALRQLEEMLALPGTQSRALPRIESLRLELKTIAQQLLQGAREILGDERSNKSLEEELPRARTTAERLTSLKEVLALYPDDSKNERGQLDEILRQMSQRIEKLSKLQEQLTKASDTELWDEVLRSDDFIQLERLESEMIVLELPGFLEQISFQRKLREWRFVHRHLSDGTDRINKLYIVTEDFEEVQKIIASLCLRPRTLSSNDGFPNRETELSQIQQEDYTRIFETMGKKLIVTDLYGSANLVGWQQVSQGAAQRQKELEAWQKWKQNIDTGRSKVHNASLATQTHQDGVKLGLQKRDWETVLFTIDETLEHIQTEPLNDSKPVPILSAIVKRLHKEGKEHQAQLVQLKHASTAKIQAVEMEISKLGGIPTDEELKRLIEQKNVGGLERRLVAFGKIGPSSPKEENSLRIHKNILVKMKQEANQPWWKKLGG